MFLDPFTLLTGGMYRMLTDVTDGYLSIQSVIGVIKTPPNKGGNDGAVYDDYKTPFEYITEEPKVVLSIDDISDAIKGVVADEIFITLEFKPKSIKNVLIECKLLERKITAELLKHTDKIVKVEVIYKP